MNAHKTAHNAKIRHLCSCLVLCLHLASGAIPGPCQHSVTEEHLLILRKLIINQVQNGCFISFKFTEHQHLNEVCYIKAAFPHILDLLNIHFRYEKGSDNYIYTSSLTNLIYDIYSQKCVPPINEEIEENPVMFARQYISLPREGLQKIEEIFQMYKRLMSENDKPVNWNCEDEYSKNVPESTTAFYSQTTGTPECQCSCCHHMQAFIFTKFASTEIPASSHTQSGAYIFKNKNERSKAPEPAVEDKIANLAPNQISAISPGPSLFPGLHTKTKLFTDQHFLTGHKESRTTPNLMNNSSNSSVAMGPAPHPVTSSPSASSSKLGSITTRSVLQSATSQPSEKMNTTLMSDRNPVLVLVKRSLNTREQKAMQSDSFSKLLQSWSNKTIGIIKNKKAKLLEITPEETENSSIKHGKQSSRTQVQMHLHMTKALSKTVFKNNSREPDSKGSRCQKSTEDRSDQNTGDRVKKHCEGKEYQLPHISMDTMFLIPAACLLLLFITVLFYCKQQQIKNRHKEDGTIHF